MDISEWIKKNKKALAERIIKESNSKTEARPVAIIMAGIPGAGKTEFLERLLKDLANPLVRIDLDTIVTSIKGYRPENYYAYRASGNLVLEKVLDKAIKNNLSFSLDGTFAHDKGLFNLKRALYHGYFVFFVYTYQDPVTAWGITKAREVVTKRGVEKEGFIETCLNVPEKVQVALDTFTGNKNFSSIAVIKDNLNAYSIRRDFTSVDDITPKKYTKNELKDSLDT